MKKEDLASFIVYLVMIAVAIIIGFTLVKDMFYAYNRSGAFMNPYAFAVITILLGILLNAIGLEVGHVIGGKIGGYTIVSFNVFGFCWIKKNGKFKFGFHEFDGLTGETVLAPKSEKSNPKHFVWFPLVLFVIELITCIILYSLGSSKNVDNTSPLVWLGTAGIIFVTISSMMALYNFVPVRLDSMTDGYRLTLISKPQNIVAYNELMRVENLQREGKPVGVIKTFDEVTDFTASINLITVYECLSKKNYDEALKLIDKMCDAPDKISRHTLYRLIAQKLYIKLVTLPLEEARKYYNAEVDDDVRRFISNDLSMESIRAYVLIAGMLDDSLGEVEFANSRKPKAIKHALKSRIPVEEELYKHAIQLVKETHKDWDMSNL